MASQISKTASSSSISPTSISEHEYDVFLSFSWEDRGKSLADHLYAALVEKGFHPFREAIGKPDNNEAIASQSLRAILESKVFIVIFSKTYADSRYNLDELVKIMDGREATGKVVLPIYYHVDPSDVRKQGGSYGKAFYNHGANQGKEKIDNWRTALRKAGSTTGFHLHREGYESTIIKQITDFVIDRLKHVYFGDDNLVGSYSRSEELKSLIGIGVDDVRMLGVCGIGGIGKTTIAKFIYSLISYQFNGASFLPNVREQSMLQLQKKLLIDITGVKDQNLKNVSEGRIKIKTILRQKVLIVVDDVDCFRQLEYLVPDRDWFGSGSRIIITTRDRHLLHMHGVDAIYEVPGLDFEESMLLFSLCAFKQRFPGKGYVKLSRYIVNYAKGHPLTLKVLGHSLYGKTISEWEKALDQLEHQPTNEIQNVLKISYDGLDDTTKNIFLDIACFFNGEEREFVSRILDGAVPAMASLHDRSLLTFSNNKILMHPLIQRMGQEVVHQECPPEPGKQSRLWRSKDVHHVLVRNEGTSAIEGIFLNMSTSEPIKFTTQAFRRMNGLRLLKIYRDFKCGSMVNNYEVHVSMDFEFPSYELRYFHWDGYPLESLPSNFHGENLIELNLQYSKLRELWKGSKLLERLKVINLSHSQQLIQIPDFSDTPNLESLILEGCTNLENLPSSIWELDSLVNLDLSHCSKLQKLPVVQGNLYSLEYLNLASCKRLESLPESLCNLKCLKTLNVIGYSKLPENLGSLECLEKLCASSAELICPRFDSSLAGLCSLKILDVHGTHLLEGAISSDIGSLYALEELNLSYCNLKEGGIPHDICCLYSLRTLDLSGNHFRRLTDATSKLSKLRVLGLRHCKNLVEIPELPSSLRILDAHGCTGMATSSSTSLSPWQRQLSCFKSAVLQEIQELKYRRLLSLPETSVSQGFSTVIPASAEIPRLISLWSIGPIGSAEVTVDLYLNWYDDNAFVGFALCCVYIPQQDANKDESVDEPDSSMSKDGCEESKNAMVNITQPYHLGCELTFLDDEIGFVDSLSFGSSCQCDHNDGESEQMWITYYPNFVIKKKYRSEKSRHFKASFCGYVDGKLVKVEKCAIGLVHVDL